MKRTHTATTRQFESAGGWFVRSNKTWLLRSQSVCVARLIRPAEKAGGASNTAGTKWRMPIANTPPVAAAAQLRLSSARHKRVKDAARGACPPQHRTTKHTDNAPAPAPCQNRRRVVQQRKCAHGWNVLQSSSWWIIAMLIRYRDVSSRSSPPRAPAAPHPNDIHITILAPLFPAARALCTVSATGAMGRCRQLPSAS